MAKNKKKKNLADRVNLKTQMKKSINPFEVHVNRQKFNVLGRELKTDRGLPGVARAKALKKRKETLLQEYKVQHKNNKFFDRRIGEKNSNMTKEDILIARFCAEKMSKSHNRKSIFNISDDGVSFKGQSIAEAEKFGDPFVSDDEDNEESKGLDANFVEDASFGGGNLGNKTSRGSIINHLIAESKIRKVERQMAKEKIVLQTEELDAEWKELLPYVNMGEKEEITEKKDSYDILMNELKFEPRGTPSNKLKSEAEIAEEEARRLRELEEERLRRMRGEEPSSNSKIQHRSADDLDDGFNIEEESFELTYDKEGNPIGFENLNDDTESGKETVKTADDFGYEEEEDCDSENESVENEGGEDDEKVDPDGSDDESDNMSDLQINGEDDEKREVDSEDEIENADIESSKSNKETEGGESLTEIKNSQTDSKKEGIDENITLEETFDKGDQNNTKGADEHKIKQKKKVSFSGDITLVSYKKDNDISLLESEEKNSVEKTFSDIPFIIEVPGDYEELSELFKNRTPEQLGVIVERMIKCNHPSLNEKNKDKLECLFALLIQYLNDADGSESWLILDCLAPHLFDLTQFSPANAAYCMSEVLNEKHSDYLKKKHKYPTSETFLFLKLVPLLFPTSDKRHPVTTPAFVFICEMLRYCNVTTRRTIGAGLFLVSLFTEYICLSKRVMPEALNFLSGVISMASPLSDLPVLSPFKKEHKFLYLHESQSELENLDLLMAASDFAEKGPKIDNDFRIRSIYCTLKLLHILAENYEELTGSKLIFQPIKKHLDKLEIQKYPAPVRQAYDELLSVLERIFEKELEPLVMETKKPKALRLYEPAIQPVYENRKKIATGDKAKHAKLLCKYKKEMKGALREIRRDRSFIANLKFKEIAASDAERKRKVQEIYSWGAQQEGEYKKLKRKKK